MMDVNRSSVDDGYSIMQDNRLIEMATTYEEAINKGKALKRSAPQSKIEIIFDGIAAEMPDR